MIGNIVSCSDAHNYEAYILAYLDSVAVLVPNILGVVGSTLKPAGQ